MSLSLLDALDDELIENSRFSRVVYDCTAAIYYGSTSYKSYYRRALALDQLGHTEKAIAGISLCSLFATNESKLIRCRVDFKSALEIEPWNPALKLELEEAEKRL